MSLVSLAAQNRRTALFCTDLPPGVAVPLQLLYMQDVDPPSTVARAERQRTLEQLGTLHGMRRACRKPRPWRPPPPAAARAAFYG